MSIPNALRAILWREFISSVRSRREVATEVYFVAGTVLVVAFALSGVKLSVEVQAGLLWLVLYFAAIVTVARSYVVEQERGTLLYLQLVAPADAVYWGKMLSSICWLVLTGLAQYGLLVLLEIIPFSIGLICVQVIGSCAIATALSLLAAIVAVAQLRYWMLAVIALPIVMPVVFLGIEAAGNILAGAAMESVTTSLAIAVLYVCVVSVVGWWLFPVMWGER